MPQFWLLPGREEQSPAMSVIQRLMTADELFHTPADGFRYELVRGELRRMSSAGYQRGRIVMNVATPLDQFVRTPRLGTVCAAETGFLLHENPDTVRAADVAFIRRERTLDARDATGYWPGAPNLVVEAVSPHDLYADVDEKVTDWLDAGTRAVVVVNPRRRTVTVYQASAYAILHENNTLDGGEVVPGWQLPVAAIFEE